MFWGIAKMETTNGRMKCSASDGKCYRTWWYWLDTNMDSDTVNYTFLLTDQSSYSLTYSCERPWWTMWTSVNEEMNIFSSSTSDMSSSLVTTLKDYITTHFADY